MTESRLYWWDWLPKSKKGRIIVALIAAALVLGSAIVKDREEMAKGPIPCEEQTIEVAPGKVVPRPCPTAAAAPAP